MDTSTIFLIITIAALVIVVVLVFLVGKDNEKNRLTPLAGLAFAFIVAGIIFGAGMLIGYGLMGIGVILSIVDIFIRKGKS